MPLIWWGPPETAGYCALMELDWCTIIHTSYFDWKMWDMRIGAHLTLQNDEQYPASSPEVMIRTADVASQGGNSSAFINSYLKAMDGNLQKVRSQVLGPFHNASCIKDSMPMSKVITSNSWRLWVLSAVMHNSLPTCSWQNSFTPIHTPWTPEVVWQGPRTSVSNRTILYTPCMLYTYVQLRICLRRHAETCNVTSYPAEQDRALPMVDCPVHVRYGLNHLPFYFMPIYCSRIAPWAPCALTRSIVPTNGRLLWYIIWKEKNSIDNKALMEYGLKKAGKRKNEVKRY